MDVRIKTAVADIFPFRDGESFEDWAARVRQQPFGLRALTIAYLSTAIKDIDRERSERKQLWIAAARVAFEPGDRQPCFICKRYQSVTEAHHVVPLSDQFDRGFDAPDQEHEWLCPTHHVMLHVWLDQRPSQRAWQAHAELDEAEAMRLLDLVKRASG